MRSPGSTQALPWTDGVRGLGCLVMIAWHSILTVRSAHDLGSAAWVTLAGAAAHAALLLFILLSGYLLGRHWRQGRFLAECWRFARRRTWRIVPTFWAALTVTVLVMLLLGLRHPGGTHWDVGLPLTWGRAALNYLLLTDLAGGVVPFSHPLWTVPVEYHLYLLAPLVVLLRAPWLVLGLGALGTVVVRLTDPPDYLPSFFVLAFAAAFLVGLRRQQLASASRHVVAREVVPVAVAGLVVVAGIQLWVPMAEGPARHLAFDAVLTPLLLAWLLAGDLSGRPGPTREWLATRPMRWVGDRSYSSYLMHGVAIEVCWRFLVAPLQVGQGTGNLVLIPAAAALTFASGELLYRFVERPTTRRSVVAGRARVPQPSLRG